MVDTSTVAARLEFIRRACGYPTRAAMMKAIGQSPQQWGNWAARDSVGRGDTVLHKVTGVSILWIKTGEGEPFPDGPRIYEPLREARIGLGPRVIQIEHDVDQLGVALAHLVRVVAEQTPAAGAALTAAIRSSAASYPDRSIVFEAILRALETAQTAPAERLRVAEPPAPTRTPERRGQ